MNLKKLCLAVAVGALAVPAVSASQKPDHLIITEVATSGGKYDSGHESSEYTEIYNPTASAIDLSDYYLSDWSRYFDLPFVTAYPQDLPREGGADWIVQFPSGTSIPAGGTVVVTANAQYFLDAYFASDLAAFQAIPGAPQLFEHFDSRVDIEDMIDHNLDSIADPNLKGQSHTDAGENIFLFKWDGNSDLVQDVDIVMYADAKASPGSDNGYYPKGGVPTDGPDPGGEMSNYENDLGNDSNLAVRNGTPNTTRQIERRSIFEIGEIQTGGNGITGHDETTEQTNISWIARDSDTLATPGVVAPEVVAADTAPIIWARRDAGDPNSFAPVNITADIRDDGTIASAKIMVSKNSAAPTAINMTNSSGDTWTGSIPAYDDGTTVTWYVTATDNTGNTRTELDYNYLGSDFTGHYYIVLDQPISEQDVFFTEMYYDTQGTDNAKYSEFVEIYNSRDTAIDLSYSQFWYNSNPYYVFPEGSVIEGKGYMIIAAEGILFQNHDYPGYDLTPVVDLDQDGVSYFGNGSGTFNLVGPNQLPPPGFNQIILPFETVTYDEANGWPTDPEGTNFTIELAGYEDSSVNNNDGGNWQGATQLGGSPGRRNSVLNVGSTIAITGGQRDIQYPGFGTPITISADVTGATTVELFYKTNNAAEYQSKAMTKGAGNTYTAQVGPYSEFTNVKYYIKASDNSDHILYQPFAFPLAFQVDDVPTNGADVVINEICYNGRGTDNYTGPEFIELYNTTDQPIDLSLFEIGRDPGDYWTRRIPYGTIIQPHDFIVANANNNIMVREYPGIDTSRLVNFQWWTAKRMNDATPPKQSSNSIFANSGARNCVLIHVNAVGWNDVQSFYESGQPSGSIPTDQVPYEVNQNGWPACGDGYSIELINPTMDNSVGASWLESAVKGGSPLAVNGVSSKVSDWSVY